jgi:hypothetical protein
MYNIIYMCNNINFDTHNVTTWIYHYFQITQIVQGKTEDKKHFKSHDLRTKTSFFFYSNIKLSYQNSGFHYRIILHYKVLLTHFICLPYFFYQHL